MSDSFKAYLTLNKDRNHFFVPGLGSIQVKLGIFGLFWSSIAAENPFILIHTQSLFGTISFGSHKVRFDGVSAIYKAIGALQRTEQ